MRSALSERSLPPAVAPGDSSPLNPFLDRLRRASRDVRCKGYVDLFGACAALSRNGSISTTAASEVLMRCLSQALGRRPILRRAGEAEMSFDETWLLALARSLRGRDDASAAFLLRSRVPARARRHVVFLLRTVIDNYEQD